MTRLVNIRKGGVSLGGRPILRRIDFSLDNSQIAGVAGPNGSGKTTLIRAIATLSPLDEGTGMVLGVDIRSSMAHRARSGIAMIGHIPMLIPELTLQENLIHAARLSGVDEQRVDRALEVVGLDRAAPIRASTASFGTQRRLEVARAILTEPRLLLLDEAFSGLDDAAQGLIDALISRTVDSGGGVVMVSHDAGQLESRCQLRFSIAAGKLEVSS